MSIDPTNVNLDLYNQLYVTGTEDIDQENLNAVINEDHLNDSITEAGDKTQNYNFSVDDPQLIPPDPNFVNQDVGAKFDPNALTAAEVTEFLNAYPQFANFLNSQNLLTEEEIHNFVINTLLENPNSIYSAEALSGTALAEQMYNILSVTNDPAMRELWENLRADILVANNPMAQVLIESIKQDLINQGMDPVQAKTEAISQALHQLDVELSENGVVTPFYGTHPAMPGAIAALLTTQLGSSEASANFIAGLENILQMENGLMEAMTAIAAVNSGQEVSDVVNAHFQQFDSAQELVEVAMAQLQAVPLPEGQRMAILDFMQKISEALAELKELVAFMIMTDAKRAREEFVNKVDLIMTALADQLKKLEKMWKEMEEAKDKKGPLGELGKFLDVGSVMNFVIMQVVAIVVCLVLTVFFFAFLGPLSIIIVPLLFTVVVGPLLAGSIITFGLAQSDKLEEINQSVFMFAMGAIEAIIGKEVTQEVVGYVAIGAAALLVAIPILLAVITIALAPLGIIAIIVIICLNVLLIPLMILCLPLLVVLVVLTIIVVLLALLIIIASPAVFLLGSMWIPDFLIRSGLVDDAVGRGFLLAFSTMATGQSTASGMAELNAEDQALLDQEGSIKGDIDMAESKKRRVGGMAGMYSYMTALQKAAEEGASEAAIEEKQADMAEMMQILRKIIAQLQELMKVIMGGGSPAEISAAIGQMKTLIENEIGNIPPPSIPEPDETKDLPLQPYIDGFFENLERTILYILPSADAIKDMLKNAKDNEVFEEEDLIRTTELMG